jgi:hypothetical protein
MRYSRTNREVEICDAVMEFRGKCINDFDKGVM